MNRTLLAMFIALLCAFSAESQAQVNDKRLMTDADYKTFLLQVETALPKWETALKKIDPEKDERISYSLGKAIVVQRNLGLTQVGYIRLYVERLRFKRTVSGELALLGFLNSLYDAMSDVVNLEVAAGLTLSSLEKYAPEQGAILISIGNDVTARVALLEKGTCP